MDARRGVLRFLDPQPPLNSEAGAYNDVDNIRNVFTERNFPFRCADHPTLSELTDLVEPACQHMNRKREANEWKIDTTVFLDLVDGQAAALSLDGEGCEITSDAETDTSDGYVHITSDDRLVPRIRKGPEYIHFNNAQIGSHISFQKKPDEYERPHYPLSFLNT